MQSRGPVFSVTRTEASVSVQNYTVHPALHPVCHLKPRSAKAKVSAHGLRSYADSVNIRVFFCIRTHSRSIIYFPLTNTLKCDRGAGVYVGILWSTLCKIDQWTSVPVLNFNMSDIQDIAITSTQTVQQPKPHTAYTIQSEYLEDHSARSTSPAPALHESHTYPANKGQC